MKTKNKSFLEDTFILLVIGILIYAIYSFFFSSNENEQKEEVKVTVEERTPSPLLSETIENKMKNLETPSEEVTLENEIDKEISPLEQTKQKDESLKEDEEDQIDEEKVETIEIEKKEVSEVKIPEKKDDLASFYKNIEQNIYTNIKNNPLKNGEYLNIRLTILKNGKYQQLVLMDGNKEYFNQIKASISKVFPVKIDESIKENFPRYFRMKIENN